MEAIFKTILTAIQSHPKRPLRVAIDGGSASGKTTLANRLGQELGCPVVHMDDFFLPPMLRSDDRLNQPGGNVHYERFAAEVLPGLKNIFGTAPQLVQLQKLVAALEKAGCDGINIDFSVVNDMRYYNGIVFRGFVEGVPTGVLSGGQYDAMMANMGRPDKAIGFAIYPELLERLETATQKTVMDAVLLYAPGADLTALCTAVEALAEKGMTVKALPEGSQLPECRAVYKLEGNEVKEYA